MLSVAIRRLHDIGKSGAYFFVSFIPLLEDLYCYTSCAKKEMKILIEVRLLMNYKSHKGINHLKVALDTIKG